MIYSSVKGNELFDTYNLDGPQGNYAEWKESISKGYKLCHSIYMTFLKQHIYKENGLVIVSV